MKFALIVARPRCPVIARDGKHDRNIPPKVLKPEHGDVTGGERMLTAYVDLANRRTGS